MKGFWCLLFSCVCLPTLAANINQTVQINTRFSSIIGKPTWLVIIRDIKSGQVLPYQFDIKNNENYWIAFSSERAYRITASYLKFGPYAKIENFCHLENGILDGQSLIVSVTGQLTPNPKNTKCHVIKQRNAYFTEGTQRDGLR